MNYKCNKCLFLLILAYYINVTKGILPFLRPLRAHKYLYLWAKTLLYVYFTIYSWCSPIKCWDIFLVCLPGSMIMSRRCLHPLSTMHIDVSKNILLFSGLFTRSQISFTSCLQNCPGNMSHSHRTPRISWNDFLGHSPRLICSEKHSQQYILMLPRAFCHFWGPLGPTNFFTCELKSCCRYILQCTHDAVL